MNDAIKTYIVELNRQYSTGVAHEHAHRGTLKNLLDVFLPKGYIVVNEPTREKCGAPDYIIIKGNIPIAYIEAKDLFDNDLDGRKEHKNQFDRYKKSLDHIVFTDYLDFHLYENGEFVDSVRLAEGRGDKIVLNEESVDKFIQLIDRLAKATPQRITSPTRLASMMAGKARLLANVIEQALENDKEQTSELANQMKVFQEFLIHDLNEKTFADIYAQTIAYGLFSARLNDPTPDDFSRTEANELIPKSNPFLRRIFNDIAGYNVDSRIAWIIDDLVEVFRVTDMPKVMKGFGGTSGRTDPMMHFYEDFLGEYDPQLKKSRGVYYTPQPVVDFIVRAVDDILKRDFNLPMGLADSSMIEHEVVNDQFMRGYKNVTKKIKKKMHRVQILDPATGTGTFLAAAIRQIHANMEGQWGVWNDYVEKHLLPRLNGFELMMASYTIAHLKLNMVLRETGYNQQSDQRLRVYLTNSLEEYNAATGTLFAAAISQESDEASRIKRDIPVMVMMGNPPYSVSSNNNGPWITNLMESYKRDLNERNIQPLSDDYIKFIRLGQEYISRNGEGILAFICNNSFLDGLIHRQMRKELMNTFNRIYILDLHGNSRKNEISPDGSKDENVFDIMQGVSINIFYRDSKDAHKMCQLYHCDLYGSREYKYEFLNNHYLKNVMWKELFPEEPYYFFVPKFFSQKDEYEHGFRICELMQEGVSGIQTGRDNLFIDSDKQNLSERIIHLLQKQDEWSEDFREKFNVYDSSGYNLLQRISNARYQDNKILTIQYRPFDDYPIYYDEVLVKRSFYRVMRHLIRENCALVVSRQCVSEWRYIFVANKICDMNYIASAGKFGAGYVFPLYLYSEDGTVKKPNFNEEIVQKIEESLGETIDPQELFDYIYAMLHSPNYRTKYKEFLKIDFPRIPYPTNAEEYHRLSAIGSQLRKLHLMEDVPQTKLAQFDTPGDNLVDKPQFKDGNVWVNKEQCFSDVPEIAWNFYIGGYQPAQKWLKDRKGRILTYDDITHYRNIITILVETDRLMNEIDLNINN